MRALNYRKGLWRLWLVIAVPWVLFFSFQAGTFGLGAYQAGLKLNTEICDIESDPWAGLNDECMSVEIERATRRQIQNYRWELEDALGWMLMPFYVLASVIGLFYVGRWVTRGFKAT